MAQGNRSILDNEAQDRSLRLFEPSSGEVTYLGEFELDPEQPYYETDGRESENAIRKVIVFKLRPRKSSIAPTATTPVADGRSTEVDIVPVEEQYTEHAFVDPSREPYEAERREAKLVLALRDFLAGKGNDVSRLRVIPAGEAKPLFADLLDETANVLVEAKGSVSREAIRMAIGQLADYSRFRPDATRTILVPERPRADLVALARSVGAVVLWPADGSYEAEPRMPW
jgi:hypothetical protein